MSIARTENKARPPKVPDLDPLIAQAKIVLRQLRDALEDLEDRRDLAKARKKNAGKAGTNWEAVKKELGLEF
jgi:hypothetical protein